MKKKLMVWICLIGWVVLFALGPEPAVNGAAKTGRDDGLTVMKLELPKDTKDIKIAFCFLTLVLKNGYADDPAGKAGLTGLTNQLLYRVFSNTSASDVSYDTYANYSQFNFLISAKNYKSFCNELDTIIRMEALMLYDECHEIIQDYKNEPKNPGSLGLVELYKMLYGNDHPYHAVFSGNLPELDINAVNDWFRKIYRPSNMIISASADLPADFLMKPSGRELKQPVTFTKTPPATCVPRPAIHWTQIEGKVSSIFIGLPGPALNDDDLFSMIVLKRYLQKELWDKVREEMGLCYDIQVNYSYLQEPTAPSLTISLETLPADADTAIAKIVDILQQVTVKNSIPSQRLSLIREQEKSRASHLDNSMFQKLNGLVYEKLFGVLWLKDSNEYLKRFNQVTADDLAKLAAARLKYLKVAVARPNSDTDFEQASQAIGRLTKMGK
jgi:predicted Zn-dependent peptidase